MKKIASIVGARPQFIKLMPVVRAIEKCAALEVKQGKSDVRHYSDRRVGKKIIKEVAYKYLSLQEYLELKGEARYGI